MQVKPHWTGTLLFAQFGTTSAEKEISTIGLGSSFGILLLVRFGFRSIRPMLTEMVAVGTGCLVAFAITHWVFGGNSPHDLECLGKSGRGLCRLLFYYGNAIIASADCGFAGNKPLLPGCLWV